MGAWNSAPFGNDRAVDLLEELGELDDAGKSGRLHDVLTEGLSTAPGNAPLAHEVVAAAALIALALPGGLVLVREPSEWADSSGQFDPDDEDNADDEWTAALLRSPSPELIKLAINATRHVTGVDSQWRSVWMVDGDRTKAIHEMRQVVAVLERASH